MLQQQTPSSSVGAVMLMFCGLSAGFSQQTFAVDFAINLLCAAIDAFSLLQAFAAGFVINLLRVAIGSFFLQQTIAAGFAIKSSLVTSVNGLNRQYVQL